MLKKDVPHTYAFSLRCLVCFSDDIVAIHYCDRNFNQDLFPVMVNGDMYMYNIYINMFSNLYIRQPVTFPIDLLQN